ncbi:hypothetical protein QVD17_11609 [Tagetes erecta]|uniref:Uncharacterized protein n=1 Tax=Tagetes erecta TaxID=13708 RepID=A0AAD8L106_TARER|nr:hypothetical protein QVD17_11609 [Tagetes erecta]
MADDNPPPPLILAPRTTTQILHQTTTIFYSTHHHVRIFLILSFLLFSSRVSIENLTHHLITSFVDNNHEIESLLSRFQPINTTTTTSHQLTQFGILEDDNELDHQYGFRSVEIIKNENDTDTIINNATDTMLTNFEDHELKTLMSFIWEIVISHLLIFLACACLHTWVHGVVFVVVVNDFLNRQDRSEHALWPGALLGSRRLAWLVFLRWGVRYVMSLVLGCWFFKQVVDPYLQIKIMVRLMFMPFSTVSPWVEGFEPEFFRFIVAWFLFDILVSFGYFSLHAWVAMADRPRRTRRGVIEEGCHLLSLMSEPAINLKLLEVLGCDWFVGHILPHILGKVHADMILCNLEVYFMVAWMMHYVSVKSKDAALNGQRFGRRELEVMVE